MPLAATLFCSWPLTDGYKLTTSPASVVVNMAISVVVTAAILGASQHTSGTGEDGATRPANHRADRPSDQTTGQRAARRANCLIGGGARRQRQTPQRHERDLARSLPPLLLGTHRIRGRQWRRRLFRASAAGQSPSQDLPTARVPSSRREVKESRKTLHNRCTPTNVCGSDLAGQPDEETRYTSFEYGRVDRRDRAWLVVSHRRPSDLAPPTLRTYASRPQRLLKTRARGMPPQQIPLTQPSTPHLVYRQRVIVGGRKGYWGSLLGPGRRRQLDPATLIVPAAPAPFAGRPTVRRPRRERSAAPRPRRSSTATGIGSR